MNRTPAQQWSALSALYEEADGLGARELGGFLARLEAEGNELLPQLRRMLDARDHMETDDFLSTMPRLSTEAQAATSWSAGRRVGPYKLVRPLGEGGMAEVWLAERDDGAFKRQVAIKLPYPKPGRETFAVRFDRERDILATLRHPNIAGLFDAGVTAEGQAWLALEYVEGQPISVFCDERRLSVRERVQLFRQVLLAVQHAHANLVIHRDLKPANILVTPQGEVRLLDFGIAKLLESEGDAVDETELTRQAGRSMTPRYASPEQLMGVPLTTACDVYSLGVVFYELVSGERPYELKVESPAQLEHAILDAEPRAPSKRVLDAPLAEARGTTTKGLRKSLAPELDAIALRCLAKKPSARYSSVDALLADADRWLGGETVLAKTPTAWYRLGKFARRHKIGVALGTLSVASLVGIAAVAVVLGLQAKEESARASASRDFMLSLFQRANQEKARGADITARELLETGRKDLKARLQGQPRLQAELLMGIAKIQMEMGEYVHADSTYEEAVRIYARLAMAREETLARASHAYNSLRMGDPLKARSLVREAREVPGRPLDDGELEANLKRVEGWISNIMADSVAAKSAFEESRRLALRHLGPQHPLARDALVGLIYAQRQLREFDGALKTQSELENSVLGVPGSSSAEAAGLDMGRAELLQYAGRYLASFRHTETAWPRCVESLGANEERCLRLLLARLQASMRLGRVSADEQGLAQVEKLVNDGTTPALQAEALFVAFRWHSVLGRSATHQQLAEQVARFGVSGNAVNVNPALKAKALLLVAESALLHGDPASASRWIADAQSLMADPVARPPILDAVAKSLSAIAALADRRFDEALPAIAKAHQAMSQVVGPEHPLANVLLLNRAVVLEQLGRGEEALQIVRYAEPVLLPAYGADSAILRQLSRMKARLASSFGNPAQGVTRSIPLIEPFI